MSRLFAVLLACALVSVSAHAADPAQEKADFGRHLETVKALTAALQRDDDAGTPSIKEALASVGARQKAAEELAAGGEYELASSILDEGYKKLIATLITAKSVAPSKTLGSTGADVRLSAANKSQADYERKVLTADALMAAAKRVDSEKVSVHRSQIADLELQLSRAKAAASDKDWSAANRLLDDVLAGEKKVIASAKSDPSPVGLKTASMVTNPQKAPAAMTDGERKAQITKTLRSVEMLRKLIVRRSQERGIDNAAALGQIEKMVMEAHRLETSDPKRSLEVADRAYQAATLSVQTVFGK